MGADQSRGGGQVAFVFEEGLSSRKRIVAQSVGIRRAVRAPGAVPYGVGRGSLFAAVLGCWTLAALSVGCGTTRDKQATEQLLLSDAVDRAVAAVDFTPLTGKTVYLDTTYLRQIKANTFVNADYIVSSLRQQMVLAGCLLQDNADAAEIVAEARVGVLGSDAHDVNYGVPGNQNLTAAASLVNGGVPLPSLPEVSLARKTEDTAAAKLAIFAYDRATRDPVWQSGLSVARSTAEARWIMGAGPFRNGMIYAGTHFAGENFDPDRPAESFDETLTPADLAYRLPAVLRPEPEVELPPGTPLPAGTEDTAQLADASAPSATSPPSDGAVQTATHVEAIAP